MIFVKANVATEEFDMALPVRRLKLAGKLGDGLYGDKNKALKLRMWLLHGSKYFVVLDLRRSVLRSIGNTICIYLHI